MAEYIEREAAIAVCGEQYKECLRKSDWCGDTVAWNICFGIKQIPAADVEPVRHARWNFVAQRFYDGEFIDIFRCSACSIPSDGKSRYCPNCGARMDLEVSE